MSDEEKPNYDDASVMAQIMAISSGTTLARMIVPQDRADEAVEYLKKNLNVNIIRVYVAKDKLIADITAHEGQPSESRSEVWRERTVTHFRGSENDTMMGRRHFHWTTVDSVEIELGCPGMESDAEIIERCRVNVLGHAEMRETAMNGMDMLGLTDTVGGRPPTVDMVPKRGRRPNHLRQVPTLDDDPKAS